MMHVDSDSIVQDVEGGQEGFFYNFNYSCIAILHHLCIITKTEEINFCPEGVLPAIDGIIADEVESWKSARVCFP